MKQLYHNFKTGLFLKGSFVRNSSVFASGAIGAYLIGFLFTPFITRIYNPEDYGAFALFNAILAFISSGMSFNYSNALLLTKSKAEFYRLSRVVLVIAVLITTILLVLIALFKTSIVHLFNLNKISNYLYLLPILGLFSILQLIADKLNIYKKEFKVNAIAKLFSVGGGKGVVLFIGYNFGSVIYGLISGEVIIRVLNTFLLLNREVKAFFTNLFSDIKKNKLIATAKEYKNYPTYIFPTTILNQLSIHAPVFVISYVYLSEELGYYSLAMSLLGIPVQVIGFSIGKVYFQKASETYNSKDLLLFKKQLINLFYLITILASIGYSIVFSFGSQIFTFVAGSKWTFAGEVARILSISLALQLVGTVIGPVLMVIRKEKVQFYASIVGSIIFICMIITGVYKNLIFRDFILLIAIGIAIKDLLLIFFTFIKVKYISVKHVFFSLLIIGLIFYSSYLLFIK